MEVKFRERRSVQIENECLRVVVLLEGGHVAEIYHKQKGVNPLWQPPWPTIEPTTYDLALHPVYGADAESRLLSGIHGHNLCLDLFGPPSKEEEAVGMLVHGEAGVIPYEYSMDGEVLVLKTVLPLAQLGFTRRIRLDGYSVFFNEVVENFSVHDRPIAYTQHVTLGPPFLQHGKTVFNIPNATQSKVLETDDAFESNTLKSGAEFNWPFAPSSDGTRLVDLQTYTNEPKSSTFTTHKMEGNDPVFFTATTDDVTFGYRWDSKQYPWLGIWEENRDRVPLPWDGKTITRGMEFGVSPFPESRRSMIDRGKMFGVPTFRWILAKSQITTQFEAFYQ